MSSVAVPYARGYKRNPGRLEAPRFTRHQLMGHHGTAPAMVNLAPFAPPIFDQGQTGSCVAHARSRGIYTARGVAQRPMSFIPSPDDIYKLVRCYMRLDWDSPLTDDGSDPVDSIDAVQTWGVRPMGKSLDGRFSDCDVSTVNELPRLDNLEADSEFQLLDDRQILDTGANRIAAVMQCLAMGYPVCIDVAGGGKEFQEYSGGILKGDGTELDHYVVIVGYAKTAAGVVFDIHNSWGLDWGVAGTAEAAESVINAAGDLIACIEHGE